MKPKPTYEEIHKGIKDITATGFSDLQSAEVDPAAFNKTWEFYKCRFGHYGYDNRTDYNFLAVTKYAAQLWHGQIKKGLCLVGDTGRGKSFAFDVIKKLFDIEMFNALDIVSRWHTVGENEIMAELLGNPRHGQNKNIAEMWRDCIIDDIGYERTIVNFGEKYEAIDLVIERRERLFNATGARTHCTFNLSLDKVPDSPGTSITERYGPRFVSRLNRMCHVITLKGPDRRVS